MEEEDEKKEEEEEEDGVERDDKVAAAPATMTAAASAMTATERMGIERMEIESTVTQTITPVQRLKKQLLIIKG